MLKCVEHSQATELCEVNQMDLPKAIGSLHHIPAADLLQQGNRLAGEGLGIFFFLPVELLTPDADGAIRELTEKSQQQASRPQRTRMYPFLTGTLWKHL